MGGDDYEAVAGEGGAQVGGVGGWHFGLLVGYGLAKVGEMFDWLLFVAREYSRLVRDVMLVELTDPRY